jgi:hypothetical protein
MFGACSDKKGGIGRHVSPSPANCGLGGRRQSPKRTHSDQRNLRNQKGYLQETRSALRRTDPAKSPRWITHPASGTRTQDDARPPAQDEAIPVRNRRSEAIRLAGTDDPTTDSIGDAGAHRCALFRNEPALSDRADSFRFALPSPCVSSAPPSNLTRVSENRFEERPLPGGDLGSVAR